jgi:parallel beta-helix repeat protein
MPFGHFSGFSRPAPPVEIHLMNIPAFPDRTLFAAFCLSAVLAPLSAWSGQAPGNSVAAREERKTVYLDSGDGKAISAAIASLPEGGGFVVLGPTLFPVSEAIVIDRDGVELRGMGHETILRLTDGANSSVIVIGSTATPVARIVRGIAVGHLVIDGNRGAQQFECCGGPCDSGGLSFIRNNGVTVRGAEDVLLSNLATHNCRSGGVVLEKVCRRIHVVDLESYNNEFDGLACYETEDSVFDQLQLHENRSAGLSIDWKFNRNLVIDSTFTRNGSQGIFMRDSNVNTFRNLYLRDNGEQGLFVAETREIPGSACRENRFERMTITGNKTQGIRVNDASCTDNVIADSRIAGNTLENVSLAEPGLLIGVETVRQD